MKWYPIIRILLYLRKIESKEKIMKKVSNDMRWFVDQLRMAEGILANALERAENFSEHDKRIISKSEMRLVWPTSLCYNCLLPKLHNKLREPYNKKQFSLWYLRYFKC